MATKKILTDITSNGSMESTSFIKTGGTSSQFLKADGSVDGNEYILTVNGDTPDQDGDINIAIPSNTSDLTNDSGFLSSTTGDWTGTLDGQEGSYYLDYNNFTNTPTIPTGVIDGGGTAGYVPKWSDGDTLTDSVIRDNGTSVGIGMAPVFPLDVNGAIAASGTGNMFNYGTFLYTNMSRTGDGIIDIYGNGAGTENFTITNNGSDTTLSYDTSSITMKGATVGIGTNNPQRAFHVDGITRIEANGQSLDLVGTDHTFIGLYPDGAAAGRKGYFGFPGATSDRLTIANEFDDDISFFTNGSEKVTIENSGDVGIGTTSPGYKLEVDGTVGIGGAVSLREGSTNWDTKNSWTVTPNNVGGSNYTFGDSTNYLKAFSANAATVVFSSASTETARITTSGVESPAFIKTGGTSAQFLMADGSVSSGGSGLGYLLDTTDTLTGDLSVTGRINVNTGGLASVGILGKAIANGWAARYDSNDANYSGFYFDANNDASMYLRDDAGNTNVLLRSDSSSYFNGGNVGIGETNPAQKLHVVGNSEITGDIFLGRYIFHNDDNNTWMGFPLADTISFRTSGSDRMYINSSGNIGIGTTAPASNLSSSKVLELSSTGNAEIVLDHTDGGTGSDIGLLSFERNGDHLAHIKASHDGATDSAYISFHAQATGGSFVNAASNEKMRINSSGNVGIGTTSPSYKLDVTGDSRFGGTTTAANTALTVRSRSGDAGDLRIRFDAASTTQRSYISDYYTGEASNIGFERNNSTGVGIITFDTSNGSFSPSERMRINSDGNIGIGVTDPSEKLEVNGTIYSTPVSYASNQDAYALKVGAYNSANFDMGLKVKSTAGGSPYLSFETSSASDVLVMNGTNVGIGQLPSHTLDVDGTIRGEEYIYIRDTAGTDQLTLRATSTFSTLDNGNKPINYVASAHLFLDDAFAEVARFHTNGYLGIGTNIPLGIIDIEGMSSSIPAIKVNAGGGDNMILDIYNSSDAKRMGFEYDNSNIRFNIVDRNTGKLFTIQESGNVGIGDDTPSYKLDVAGTIRATGDVIAYSDKRVKENIETIKDASLKVSKLRGVEFNKIGEDEKSIGVIAQEVEEVIPEVVKTDDEGMKAVAYGNLVGLLIESNKELIKRIEKLEGIINNK